MTIYRYQSTTIPATIEEMLEAIQLGGGTTLTLVHSSPNFFDVDLVNADTNTKADLDEFLAEFGFSAGFTPTTVDEWQSPVTDGSGGWTLGNISPQTYDAVVPDQYALPSDAFTAGETTVFVRSGSYVETANIVLPNGGCLMGEPGALIDMGANSIQIGDNTRLETGGTVTVGSGATGVSGTGTTFSNLNDGDWVLLNGLYYQIQSVSDDTTIILEEAYEGRAITGGAMRGQSMASGAVRGVEVTGSASAIDIDQGINVLVDGVRVIDAGGAGTRALFVNASSEVTLNSVTLRSAAQIGLEINTSVRVEVTNSSFNNCVSHGVGHSTAVNCVFTGCEFSTNGGGGVQSDSASTELRFEGCEATGNVGNGFGLGSADSVVANCTAANNGASGVRITGANGSIVNCIARDSGGVGFGIGDTGSVTGCVARASSSEGITAAGSTSAVISGCVVHANGADGIVMGTSTVCTGNTSLLNTGDGIDTVGSSNVVISGNSLLANGGFGINVSGGSTNVLVSNNSPAGNVSGDYSDSGTLTASGRLILLQSGRNGTTAANTFYRGLNGMVLNATTGGFSQPGGILRRIAWSRSDADAATLEILVNGAVVASLPSSAAGEVSSTPNIDIAAGLVSFRNAAGSNATSNVQATAIIEVALGT